MSKQTHNADHEAVDRLLPWFVNNTLTKAEYDRVRSHVDVCEKCRENVSLLSLVQSTVKHDTATPIVPPPRADKLLDAIDRKRLGWPYRRTLARPALIAASLLLLVLGGLLFLREQAPDLTSPARYETATGVPHHAAMDYVINVRFETGIVDGDQQRVLQELSARDVTPNPADDSYRVTISLPASSLAELETYTRDIELRPEIRSVEIIALQLPMQRQ